MRKSSCKASSAGGRKQAALDGERFPKKIERNRKKVIPDRIHQKCVYQTIHQLHKEKGYCLSTLCAIAGIPRCSYYKWKNRKESADNHENAAILEEMVRLYTEVRAIYGYRRMTLNIRSRFKKGYNHKRIYRLMKSIHMQANQPTIYMVGQRFVLVLPFANAAEN